VVTDLKEAVWLRINLPEHLNGLSTAEPVQLSH
jgi:hypothetical protein